MIFYSLIDTISLLVHNTPNKEAKELAEYCRQIGMEEQEFLDLNILDTLPSFDGGYVFTYETDDKLVARLEIIEKNKIVLQVGIQIVYPLTFFFSKMKNHLKLIASELEEIYGPAMPMKVKNIKILNYGNIESVSYISTTKMNGHDVLTIRVGNRIFF